VFQLKGYNIVMYICSSVHTLLLLQDFSQSMPSLNSDGQFSNATGGEPFVCSYQKAIDENQQLSNVELNVNM